MTAIEKLLANASKAGETELTKLLAQQETINHQMDQLAKTGVLAPGITNELKMMSTHSSARIKSIQALRGRS